MCHMCACVQLYTSLCYCMLEREGVERGKVSKLTESESIYFIKDDF
jgi:hypothetical protein